MGDEIEAKFCVRSLERLESRLHDMKAQRTQSRVLEINRRFDLPDGSLKAQGRVLRLRNDSEVHLTYKGASTLDRGVLNRSELEVTVSDPDAMQQVLEALGYVQIAVYEKYRTVFHAGACHV
ncbi:MAG: class IV adenylate cyclase, partial [Bacteroidota bacterium]